MALHNMHGAGSHTGIVLLFTLSNKRFGNGQKYVTFNRATQLITSITSDLYISGETEK